METDQRRVSEMILNLTLEIIYLLTGEDYGPVRKSSGYPEKPRPLPCVSGRWRQARSPDTELPHASITNESSKKILEVTSKITELLTGEVPIRCLDVAVYFSMEEREYLREGDIYKAAMMEEEITYGMMAGEHMKSENPDDSHLTSTLPQNVGFYEGSSESSHAEGFQNFGEVRTPIEHHLQVCGQDQNDQHGPNLSPATDQSTSHTRGTFDILRYASTEPKEEPSLRYSIYNVQEHSDTDSCEEPSVTSKKNHIESLNFNLNGLKLELKDKKGPKVTEICKMTETNAVKTLNFNRNLTGDNAATLLGQVDMEEEVPAVTDHGPKPVLASGQTSCNGENAFYLNDQSQPDLHETNHTEQNHFECSECGVCFDRNSQLIEHHRLHSIEKPFACPECGKQFADRAKVAAHQLIHNKLSEAKIEHPSGEGLVLCSECGMGFTNGPALEEHQKLHQPEKAFVCLVCGKSFSRRGHLSNHNRIHNGGRHISDSKERNYFPHSSYIRKRSFVCPECGKRFPSRSHLDRHQRIHTGEKPFTCTECDRRFTDRSGLVIHQRIHTGEKPYSCDDCGKRFRDRSGLVVHQRNHTGDHPFKCLQCGKCFHNRTRLERHLNVHVNKKEFSCPDCEQCFASISTLTLHYQTHFSHLPPRLDSARFSPPPVPQTSPKSFSCSECGKSFADLSTFSLHVRTHKMGDHNGSSMPVQFEPQQRIPEPSLRLGQCLSQLGHERMEKPYFCSQCDQSFPDRTSLLAHEEKHSEEKPYKCSKCGEGFVLKGYLTKHLETHG